MGKKRTAKDALFEKKFALKKKQMALRALYAYSKSLTGSDKLHPAIIMPQGSDRALTMEEWLEPQIPVTEDAADGTEVAEEKGAAEEETKSPSKDSKTAKAKGKAKATKEEKPVGEGAKVSKKQQEL